MQEVAMSQPISNRLAIVLLPVVVLIHNTAHNAVFHRWNKLKMYEVQTLPDLFMGPEKVTVHANLLRTLAFATLIKCAVGAALRAFANPQDRAKHKAVFARFVLVYATASLLRCATFFVTLLPATAAYCKSPRIGGTYTADRAPRDLYEVMFRFDWTHSCGDLLFSGHTILITCAYMVTESLLANGTRTLDVFLVYLARLVMVPFLFLTVYTRKHYTIDVGIATLVTSLLWKYFEFVG